MRLAAVLPILVITCGNAAGDELALEIGGFRNAKGAAHLCLTSNPAYFPDCGRDPQAVKRTVTVKGLGTVRIHGIKPGRYALSVIHDENGNGKLDTWLGIPREGFGFSRNPTVRFGPPRFDRVRFDLGSGFTRQTVRMQYLL